MDIPQWYNRKLWLASKQSIDGKPVRSHSANYANRRSGFNSQSISSNWADYIKVSNIGLPNRDRGFSYRYTLPKRPTNSANIYSNPPYLTNYAASSYTYPGKTKTAITPSEPLTFSQKPMILKEKLINIPNEIKPIRAQLISKTIQPQYVEYDQDFYSLGKKYDIVHGNINPSQDTKAESGNFAKSKEEKNDLTDSINMSFSIPVPQNTPRSIENSSQEIFPRKSILKKTVNIVYQSPINQDITSRILSASFRPMVSSQPINKVLEIRKNLKSAPGSKREVRFDMTNNNIIEFSSND